MKRGLAVSILALLLLTTLLQGRCVAAQSAGGEQPLEIIGSIGGRLGDLVGDERWVYLAQGHGLTVLERAEGALVERARLPLPGLAGHVKRAGPTAYVRVADRFIFVLDLGDPARPVIRARYEMPRPISALAVAGDRLYVGTTFDEKHISHVGLQIFDLRDHDSPRLLSELQLTDYNSHIVRIDVVDGVAYVESDNYLTAVDVRDSAHTALLDELYFPRAAQNSLVAFSATGRRAYVLSSMVVGSRYERGYRLTVWDLDGTPRTQKLPFRGWSELQMQGTHAYQLYSNTLEIADLANPAEPQQLGALTLPGNQGYDKIMLLGSAALIYSYEGPTVLVDIANPAAPALLASYTPPLPPVEELELLGSRGYVNGLEHTLDFSDPRRPLAHPLADPIRAERMKIVGSRGYLFVPGGLTVVDLQDPASPKRLGTLPIAGEDVAIDGNLLYARTSGRNDAPVQILDLTDLERPRVLGSLAGVEGVQRLQVAGGRAYVASFTELAVFDVANPAAPSMLGHLPLQLPGVMRIEELVVRGGEVLLAHSANVLVVDVENPARPRLIARFLDQTRELDDIRSFAVAEAWALASSALGALELVDVGVPYDPLTRATYPAYGASRIVVDGELIYLAGPREGVIVLRLHPERLPERRHRLCFAETKLCIADELRASWERRGGLAIFGYPITLAGFDQSPDGDHFAQWFERARLESHPNNEPPYDLLLGRLGDDRLRQLGVDWATLPAAPGEQPGCLWFAETRHNVCDQAEGRGFLSYWRSHGLEFDGRPGFSYAESLALFGLPLSEPAMETNASGDTVLTQWFERARFEWHPGNPQPHQVLLGLLGSEVVAARGED